MAPRQSEQRKLVDELQPLTEYGWTIVERGTRCLVTNPEHQQCIINVGSNGGRSTNHITLLTKLNRMGLQEALAQAAADKETERLERIEADRARIAPLMAAHIPFAEPVAPDPDPVPSIPPQETTATKATPRAAAAVPPMDLPDPAEGIVTRTETITPDQAQALLDRGFSTVLADGTKLVPRPVNKRNVAKYVGIIERGEWLVMPGGISLGINGDPLNGRHRLTAIVQAGQAMPFRVHYNVPGETFAAEDTARPRSAADVLAMRGHNNAHNLASALTLLQAYDAWCADPDNYPPWGSWNRSTFTNDHASNADTRYPELAGHVRTVSGISSSAHLVSAGIAVFRYIAARAWPGALSSYDDTGHCLDEGELDRFCDVLRTGEGKKGDPPFTLRNWAHRHVRDKISARRETHLLLLVKAWNRHMAGEQWFNVTWKTSEPIPALWTPPAATGRVQRG